MKKCPFCAEEIQDDAKICRYCHKQQNSAAKLSVRDMGVGRVFKAVGVICLIGAGIYLWQIGVPAFVGWLLWKKTKYSRRNKVLIVAASLIICFSISGVISFIYRAPNIKIISPENNTSIQASSITVKGTVDPVVDSVTIGGHTVAVAKDGSFAKDVPLPDEVDNISVEAFNHWNKGSATVAVKRIFTDEEKVARDQAAAQAAAKTLKDTLSSDISDAKTLIDIDSGKDALMGYTAAGVKNIKDGFADWAKDVDAGKKSNDPATVALANQLDSLTGSAEKLLNSLLAPVDALCAKHKDWSWEDCQGIVAHRIWIGMTLDMLKVERGTPDSSNPSNYGGGVRWQWCWDGRTPYCFYGGDDGIITSYN